MPVGWPRFSFLLGTVYSSLVRCRISLVGYSDFNPIDYLFCKDALKKRKYTASFG